MRKHQSTSDYDYVGNVAHGWSLTRQDSLWGYVSEDGQREVKHVLSWADRFVDGLALVKYKDRYTYVTKEGKLLRKVKAEDAFHFAEEKAPVKIRDKWVYIDRKGKRIIERQFDWAKPFKEKRAAVAIGAKKGYINSYGTLVIQPAYDEVDDFENGVAIVRDDNGFMLIDTLGNNLLSTSYYHIAKGEDGFFQLEMRNPQTGNLKKYGLADSVGKLLLDPNYSAIDIIKSQYIRVKNDTLTGIFSIDGEKIIPMEYTYLGFISDEGYIAAQKDGKWGFLDVEGNIVLPFDFEDARMGFSEGRTWVYKDSTYMLMDARFNVIREFPGYSDAFYFVNDFAIVGRRDGNSYYDGSVYGYVDKNGKEVVAPSYQAAGPFNSQGLSIVGIRKDGITEQFLINTQGDVLSTDQKFYGLAKFGDKLFYNESGQNFTFLSPATGQPIENLSYTSIFPLKYSDRNDLAKVRLNNKIGLIDTALNELLPPHFDDIGVYQAGRMALKKGELWGFVDERFRNRIPFEFDKVESFEVNFAKVEKKGQKGMIDKSGRRIIPLLYTAITVDNLSNRIYASHEKGVDIYHMDGQLLLSSDYENVGGYWNRRQSTFRQNGRMGIMDFYFQVLVEPQFDRIGNFYDGVAWVVIGKKGGFINDKFDLIIPVELEDLEDFAAGFTRVKKEGMEYYINTKGKQFVPNEDQLKARAQEIERRKRGWIDFSS